VDAKTTREDVRTAAAAPALLPIVITARPRPPGRDGLKSKDDISALFVVWKQKAVEK
jgi:hypothetical protein|tara:strand:- start:217 stop:387 length:171 start_codon:yes stop_codon:yes gene_type:complete